jgi:hypothetical protein
VVKFCPEKRILLVCLYWHLWNSIYLVSAFLLLMYVRGLWWKTFVSPPLFWLHNVHLDIHIWKTKFGSCSHN